MVNKDDLNSISFEELSDEELNIAINNIFSSYKNGTISDEELKDIFSNSRVSSYFDVLNYKLINGQNFSIDSNLYDFLTKEKYMLPPADYSLEPLNLDEINEPVAIYSHVEPYTSEESGGSFNLNPMTVTVISEYCFIVDGILYFDDYNAFASSHDVHEVLDLSLSDTLTVTFDISKIVIADNDKVREYMKTLDTLEVNSSALITEELLNMCPNINTLIVKSKDFNIPNLANYPNIKTFKLSYYACGFEDVSKLKNLFDGSHIENLIFNESYIDLSVVEIPELKNIYFTNNINVIEGSLFYKGVYESITLPNDLTYIGDDIFIGVEVNKVVLPRNLKFADRNTFKNANIGEIVIDKNCNPDNFDFISSDKITINGHKLVRDYDYYNDDVTVLFNKDVSSYGAVIRDYSSDLKDFNKGVYYTFEAITNELAKKYIYYNCSSIKDIIKTNIDEEAFNKNCSYFSNIDYDKLSKIINKNSNLLNISLDKIYDNFKHVVSQNIMDGEILKKLYFDFDFDINSKEDFIEKLVKNIERNRGFTPEIQSLYVSGSDSELDDIRSRVIFVKPICNSSNINRDAIKNSRRILSREVFDGITLVDNNTYKDKYTHYGIDDFYSYTESLEYFNGIKSSLRKELDKINPKLFEIFEDNMLNGKFDDFIHSLNTYKNWDNFTDKKLRATYFRNEIIGRVLYALTYMDVMKNNKKLFDKNQNGKLINDSKIEKALRRINYRNVIDDDFNVDEFFEIISDNIFRYNEHRGEEFRFIVNKLIKDNPYLFDMLRNIKSWPISIEFISDTNEVRVMNNDINFSYYKNAYENGYLFNKEDEKIIRNLNSRVVDDKDKIKFDRDKISTIAHYMLNDITFDLSLRGDNKNYLDHIRQLVINYFRGQDKKDEDLEDIFRSLDVLFKENYALEYQSLFDEEVGGLTHNIFDLNNKSYSDGDRLCYILMNVSKMGHYIRDLNMKRILIDENKYKSVVDKNNSERSFTSALQYYADLYKLGIYPNTINGFNGTTIMKTIGEFDTVNFSLYSNNLNSNIDYLTYNTSSDLDTYKDIIIELKNKDSLSDEDIRIINEIKNKLSTLSLSNEARVRIIESRGKNDEKGKTDAIKKANKLIDNSKQEINSLLDLIIEDKSVNKSRYVDLLRQYVSLDSSYMRLIDNDSDTSIVDFKEINEDNVYEIINKIKGIYKLNEEQRLEVQEDIERQKLFFDTKLLIARKLILDLPEFLIKSVIDDKEIFTLDNEAFFRKYGFIIECQLDDETSKGDDLLVIYNPKFNQTYSIHLKDMDSELAEVFKKIRSNHESNLYCTNTEVLTSSKKFEIDSNIKLPKLTKLFNGKIGLSEIDQLRLDISTRLYNFFNYDCLLIKEKVNSYTYEELIDKIPLRNPDKIYFEGDDKSVLEIYLNVIGYDTYNISDELDSMLVAVDEINGIDINNTSTNNI